MVGASGAIGGVAFRAHVGGFVAGLLLVVLFRDPELVGRHPDRGKSAQSRAKISSAT